MQLETTPALQRLAVAVLVGVLIGIDRERTEARGRLLFAGVRTFPLIALAGAVPMLVYAATGPVLLVASFLAVASVAVVSYARSSAAGEHGATTEIAALATFLLGVLSGSGQMVVAGAAGVLVAVLLVAKPRLETFSKTLSAEELWAVLELAVISVIVLPLLPKRGYGPWEVFNPFEIWTVVVLVTALSFVGFIAMRMLGQHRGMAATGLVGGLVSSTAVTLSMAERSRAEPHLAPSAAAATVLACTVMCLRVGVLAAIVNAAILPRLIPVLLLMGLLGAIAARSLARRAGMVRIEPGRRIANPFSLRTAITFAVVYALVKLVVRAAQETMGNPGMLAAAALAGCADMDAPTIAFARLGALADGGWRTPAAAVAIAAVANTIVKLGLAVGLGAGAFRRQVAIVLAALALAGALGTALVYAS